MPHLHRAAAVPLALTSLLLVTSVPAAAQAPGTVVEGHVVAAESGLRVQHARVRLTEIDGPREREVETDANGRFRFELGPAGGRFSLVAERIGFHGSDEVSVEVGAGERASAVLRLRSRAIDIPGVEVSILPDPSYSIVRSGLGTTLRAQEVRDVPGIRRNVADLAAASPFARWTGQESIALAGRNERYNAVRVQGVDVHGGFGESTRMMPGGEAGMRPIPIDAIQELRVQVAPPDVRQSGFAGALLELDPREPDGTSDGTVFGRFRSHRLGGSGIGLGDAGAGAWHTGSLGGAVTGALPGRGTPHFLVAVDGEYGIRPPEGFSLGTADPIRVRVHPDTVSSILGRVTALGLDPGDPGSIDLTGHTGAVFGRMFWPEGPRGSLSLVLSTARAADDVEPNRGPVGSYELTSAGARARAGLDLAVLEWRRGSDNEAVTTTMRVFGRHSSEHTDPWFEGPRVLFNMRSDFDEGRLFRQLAIGPSDGSRRSLRQLEAGAHFDRTWRWADQHLSVGGDLRFTNASQHRTFNPYGTYTFNRMVEVAENRPASFRRVIPTDPDAGPLRLNSIAPAAHVQAFFFPTARLSVSVGGRFDVQHVLTPFPSAPTVEEDLLIDPLEGFTFFTVSPRAGLAWSLGARQHTRVRASMGMFSAPAPLSWMVDALHFAEGRLQTVQCEVGAPALRGPGEPAPTECAGSGGAAGPGDVVIIGRRFRPPTDVRATAGIDHRISRALAVSAEGIGLITRHEPAARERNLMPPRLDLSHSEGYTAGFGFEQRPAYGLPTLQGFSPWRRTNRLGRVVELTSDGAMAMLGGALALRWSPSDRMDLTANYSFIRSLDERSMRAGDAVENFGITPVMSEVNAPLLAPADLDRPHRLSLRGAWSVQLGPGSSHFSVSHITQSGPPYSYVYGNDLNADGHPVSGDPHGNDLIYVQRGLSESTAETLSHAILLDRLIELEPCLARSRGTIVTRNSCRAPLEHRLDVRTGYRATVGRLELDGFVELANLLNLLNPAWGQVHTVEPNVPVLRFAGREPQPGSLFPSATDPMRTLYDGAMERNFETGIMDPTGPYFPILPDSRWRAEIGVRLGWN